LHRALIHGHARSDEIRPDLGEFDAEMRNHRPLMELRQPLQARLRSLSSAVSTKPPATSSAKSLSKHNLLAIPTPSHR
ncbi:MAG: hypothetical protein AAGB19_17905, partial [Cyanobacteria bacterium P01_F01_bin.3]